MNINNIFNAIIDETYKLGRHFVSDIEFKKYSQVTQQFLSQARLLSGVSASSSLSRKVIVPQLSQKLATIAEIFQAMQNSNLSTKQKDILRRHFDKMTDSLSGLPDTRVQQLVAIARMQQKMPVESKRLEEQKEEITQKLREIEEAREKKQKEQGALRDEKRGLEETPPPRESEEEYLAFTQALDTLDEQIDALTEEMDSLEAQAEKLEAERDRIEASLKDLQELNAELAKDFSPEEREKIHSLVLGIQAQIQKLQESELRFTESPLKQEELYQIAITLVKGKRIMLERLPERQNHFWRSSETTLSRSLAFYVPEGEPLELENLRVVVLFKKKTEEDPKVGGEFKQVSLGIEVSPKGECRPAALGTSRDDPNAEKELGTNRLLLEKGVRVPQIYGVIPSYTHKGKRKETVVMEFFPSTLSGALKHSQLTEEEKYRIASELMMSLQDMHSEKDILEEDDRERHFDGYIHLDLKPDNLFLDLRKKLCLGDLGLAAEKGQEISGLVGTPEYVAPESIASFMNGEDIIPEELNDAWAVGGVLLELFHGTKKEEFPWMEGVTPEDFSTGHEDELYDKLNSNFKKMRAESEDGIPASVKALLPEWNNVDHIDWVIARLLVVDQNARLSLNQAYEALQKMIA